MTSRNKILEAVRLNQPDALPLPDTGIFKGEDIEVLEKFLNAVSATGGKAVMAGSYDEIAHLINQAFSGAKRIVTTVPELTGMTQIKAGLSDAHHLADVDLAVMNAHFGVAENGAVWITEDLMQERALPFIAQDLAVIIHKNNIVPTMHEAYDRIGTSVYGFGSFIAGPSKTADIEQSLVLGAHGPCSMMIFVL